MRRFPPHIKVRPSALKPKALDLIQVITAISAAGAPVPSSTAEPTALARKRLPLPLLQKLLSQTA
jgi:hypothetical protein